MSERLDVMRLEIENQLKEKTDTGGGCIYISPKRWAGRFGITEADVFRDLAELRAQGHIRRATVEICG